MLESYPEFASNFRQDIQHELTYNLREGYVDPEVSFIKRASHVSGAFHWNENKNQNVEDLIESWRTLIAKSHFNCRLNFLLYK